MQALAAAVFLPFNTEQPGLYYIEISVRDMRKTRSHFPLKGSVSDDVAKPERQLNERETKYT